MRAIRALCVLAIAAGLAVGVGASQQPAKASAVAAPAPAQAKENPRLDKLKTEALASVDNLSVLTQQMVDSVFSFGELGFQEFETSRYLIDIL